MMDPNDLAILKFIKGNHSGSGTTVDEMIFANVLHNAERNYYYHLGRLAGADYITTRDDWHWVLTGRGEAALQDGLEMEKLRK